MNTFPIGASPITILWHILKPDGTAFSLAGYDIASLHYISGRGRWIVKSPTITGEDQNIITFTLSTIDQMSAGMGDYSLSLVLLQPGVGVIGKHILQNAFGLRQSGYSGDVIIEQIQTAHNVVNLYSSADYYKFEPVIPVVGDNGNWFVNGVDTGKPSVGVHHYLGGWNCKTGKPDEPLFPVPYIYEIGDTFVVSNVAEEGGTNYKPDGTSYYGPSRVVETGEVKLNYQYCFNGTTWGKVESFGLFISDAPSDNKQYARKNGAWSEVKEALPLSVVDGKLCITFNE